MSKFKPIEVLKTLSGKVCGHSDMYFANKKGTRYTGKICYPRTNPFTADELARQAKFRGVSQSAHARLQDPTKRQADELAFRNQTKYTTLFGYVFHQEWIVWED